MTLSSGTDHPLWDLMIKAVVVIEVSAGAGVVSSLTKC